MAERAEFEISHHARRRMIDRGINLEQIRRILQHPDRLENDADDPTLTYAIKRFHHRGGSTVVRLVYNHEVTPLRIVTVYLDRKIRRP